MSYKLAGIVWNDDGTMKQELTPLQAWKEVKDFVVDGHPLSLETEEKGFPLIENALKDSEKNKEVLALLVRKGVNLVLLDYLYHMNPDHAFETYNKEMRKNWCDLYELNSEQFNRIVDYLKEQKHETRRN